MGARPAHDLTKGESHTMGELKVDPKDVPVVILCGGMGTRLREASEKLPKPLVEIGGRPIVWHIMKTYVRPGPGLQVRPHQGLLPQLPAAHQRLQAPALR